MGLLMDNTVDRPLSGNLLIPPHTHALCIPSQKVEVSSMPSLRESYLHRNTSNKATEIILQSWSDTTLLNTGLKYDALNTAWSTILALTFPQNNLTLGKQPMISRFMKGVFKSRPPTPQHETTTWDVQPVLIIICVT